MEGPKILTPDMQFLQDVINQTGWGSVKSFLPQYEEEMVQLNIQMEVRAPSRVYQERIWAADRPHFVSGGISIGVYPWAGKEGKGKDLWDLEIHSRVNDMGRMIGSYTHIFKTLRELECI